MEVIPVIDLKGGVVVHARRGQRDAYAPIETPLSASSAPAYVLAGLLRLFPFRRVYVADLDAIERRGSHDAVLAALKRRWPDVEFWVDNGIADCGAARAWLARGLGTLVLGSESQADAETVSALRDNSAVVLSLDFRGEAFQGPRGLLDDPALWPGRIIVMTLARVGAGEGPDVGRVASVRRLAGERRVYAAGGVRHAADLRAVADAGAAGVLVATALHTGAISAAELGAVGARDVV